MSRPVGRNGGFRPCLGRLIPLSIALLLGACAPPLHSIAEDKGTMTVPSASPHETVSVLLHLASDQPLQALQVQLFQGARSLDSEPDAAALQRGEIHFAALQREVSYELLIRAEGILPIQRLLYLAAESPAAVEIHLPVQPVQGRLRGQVLSAEGTLLPRAVVRCGSDWGESDAQGKLEMDLTQQKTETCQILRQGYHELTFTVNPSDEETQTWHLQPLEQPLRLRLASAVQPLGLQRSDWHTAIAGLLQSATEQGWKVQDWDSAETELDPERDLLWLASPELLLSQAQQQALLDFVQAGGKLVLSGEWAGFAHYRQSEFEPLFSHLGLEIRADSLSQAGAALKVEQFRPHFLTTGLGALYLYRSASVLTYQADRTQMLAFAPEQSFRVAQADAVLGVLASAHYGLGSVVAVGDTSLWLDQDSDADGISNFQSGANAELWQRILSW